MNPAFRHFAAKGEDKGRLRRIAPAPGAFFTPFVALFLLDLAFLLFFLPDFFFFRFFLLLELEASLEAELASMPSSASVQKYSGLTLRPSLRSLRSSESALM